MHETRYWSTLSDGRVRCDLCPRFCRLRDGQRGHCFVRENLDGRIILTTYGRSSGFCVDPIEKKPLNHFLPGSAVLSFGTAGCNLACRFCQNWDISKSRQMDRLMDSATPEQIVRVARELGCRSVAFTYNDPVIFHEYALDVASACHDLGIQTVAVTAGYVSPAPREEFYRHMDAANIDLKSFREDFYWRLTGTHLDPVLETLTYVARKTETWMEITTLIIPGENDTERELDEMTSWVVETLGPDVPMHFTAFHPDWKMRSHRPTPIKTLQLARKIAQKNGVRYAYTGNVRDQHGQCSYCPACGVAVIIRDGYTVSGWALDETGHCLACGAQVCGIFEGQPGHWGSRQLPVRMTDFLV